MAKCFFSKYVYEVYCTYGVQLVYVNTFSKERAAINYCKFMNRISLDKKEIYCYTRRVVI